MLDITNVKVTTPPNSSGWAQVHDFTPTDPLTLKSRGSLFLVVATTQADGGLDVMAQGREFLSRLHSAYFDDLTHKPFDALKNALEKVSLEFREIWKDIEIAACVTLDGVVYSAAVGATRVVICRDGSIATILDSSIDGVIAASGYPQDGDSIVIATRSFFSKVPPETLKSALNQSDLESTLLTINPLLHSGEVAGNLGAVILKFGGSSFIQNINTPTVIPQTEDVVMQKTQIVKDKIVGLFKNFVNKLPERRVYVRPDMEDEIVSENKKLTFSVGLILLIILAISIGFGVRQKRINDTKSQYQSILLIAQQQVDEAINLASISPERSRELFFDSEQKLQSIEALKAKDPKIDELRRKINDSKASVLGQYEVSPEFFLDLTLLSSGFKGDTISLSNGDIFILDKKGLKIVSVGISTKKSEVVAGPGTLSSALDLASYTDRAFVLAEDGIYEVGNTKTKVVEKIWGGEALIKSFAGNLYVLDKSGNAIYRYAGSGNTFGDKQDWLASGTSVDFSDAKGWMIDGSAYVLFPNSKISKFSLGSPQSFRISGVVPEIGTVDAMYADADNEYLYFLDRLGKRIVVTDKKGAYKAQYTSNDIGNATNLVVSEADKRIILLTGDKLLSVDIKHI